MQLRLLKSKLSYSERLFEKFEDPEELLGKLSLPNDAKDEFNAYLGVYSALFIAHKELRELIAQAEAKGITDDEEVSIDEKKFNLKKLELSLGQLHAKLELSSFSQLMNDENSVALVKDGTETILLTNDTISKELIDRIGEQKEELLEIVNAPFDQHAMSEGLSDIDASPLEPSGCSVGHRKDYERGAYFFNSDQEMALEKPTGDYVVDDLEGMVQAFRKKNNLPEEQAPNIRAMLTNLLYQGGLTGYLEIFSSKEFFHLGLIEQEGTDAAAFTFEHFSSSSLASAFFDSETGKIRIEAYLEKKGNINQANTTLSEQEKKELEDLPKIKIVEKISVEISIAEDQKLTVSDPQFSVAISRPEAIAAKFPIFIPKANVKEDAPIQPSYIDTLRPCLEDLAKFAGYDSLQALFYMKPRDGKSQFNADREAKLKAINAKFTLFFIEDHLQSVPPVDRQFFEMLYHGFYIQRKTTAELGEIIFNFVENRLLAVSPDEKMRYIHLFRMSARLSNLDPAEEIEKKEKALDLLVKSTLPKTLNVEQYAEYDEDCGFLKEIYDKLYEGDMNETESNQAIFHWVSSKLETSQSQNNLVLFDYYINFAVNQHVEIPEGFDAKTIIACLWRREDKENALFTAAQLNFSVYQELITSKKPSFWRSISEFFGWVPTRPYVTFTNEQKALLMGIHHPKLVQQDDSVEYLSDLNKLSLENKLLFLKGYNQAQAKDLASDMMGFPEFFWADLEYELFNDPKLLKGNLPLLQSLITQSKDDLSDYFFTKLYGVFEKIALNHPDASVKANLVFLNTLTLEEKLEFFYKFIIEKKKNSTDLDCLGSDFFDSLAKLTFSSEVLSRLSSIVIQGSSKVIGAWINKMPHFFMDLLQKDNFSPIAKLRLLSFIKLNDFINFNDLEKKLLEEWKKDNIDVQANIKLYVKNLLADSDKTLVIMQNMPSLAKLVMVQDLSLLKIKGNYEFLLNLPVDQQVDFLNQYLAKHGDKELDDLDGFFDKLVEKFSALDNKSFLNRMMQLKINDADQFASTFKKMPSVFLRMANEYPSRLLLDEKFVLLKIIIENKLPLNSLNFGFFNHLKSQLNTDSFDPKLDAVFASDSVNKSSIYQAINTLLVQGDVEAIQTIRNGFPKLFSNYDQHFSDSPSSIEERLQLLQNTPPQERKSRFGDRFYNNLEKHLHHLADQVRLGLHGSEYQRIESIRSLVEKVGDDWLINKDQKTISFLNSTDQEAQRLNEAVNYANQRAASKVEKLVDDTNKIEKYPQKNMSDDTKLDSDTKRPKI